MKIVIAGGSGQVGQVLTRAFKKRGDDIRILSRKRGADDSTIQWDAETLGDWQKHIDGSDIVINLAGRTVNCRYTNKNLEQMMQSRVRSTRVLGEAIAQAKAPPPLWLQMSTATIYAHTFDRANDETTGVIGGKEPDVPAYWSFSIKIAEDWEKTLEEAPTPSTRKIALRSAMVMSPDKGGIFDMLLKMTRLGLGGPIGGGRQYVSWIHETDFVRAIDFLIAHHEMDGAVNLSSPHPLPQTDFMKLLRSAAGTPIGLPAMRWMSEIGAFFLRTDTELLLKSRRVVPKRLTDAGFALDYPEWETAAMDLVQRVKNR